MPVTALAANGNLGDYIGPEAGVCWSLLVVSLAIALDTVMGILVGIKQGEFDIRMLPQFVFAGGAAIYRGTVNTRCSR